MKKLLFILVACTMMIGAAFAHDVIVHHEGLYPPSGYLVVCLAFPGAEMQCAPIIPEGTVVLKTEDGYTREPGTITLYTEDGSVKYGHGRCPNQALLNQSFAVTVAVKKYGKGVNDPIDVDYCDFKPHAPI